MTLFGSTSVRQAASCHFRGSKRLLQTLHISLGQGTIPADNHGGFSKPRIRNNEKSGYQRCCGGAMLHGIYLQRLKIFLDKYLLDAHMFNPLWHSGNSNADIYVTT